MSKRFESKCAHPGCDARITTGNGGGSWRHDKAPADRHHAYPHGVMVQL